MTVVRLLRVNGRRSERCNASMMENAVVEYKVELQEERLEKERRGHTVCKSGDYVESFRSKDDDCAR